MAAGSSSSLSLCQQRRYIAHMGFMVLRECLLVAVTFNVVDNHVFVFESICSDVVT